MKNNMTISIGIPVHNEAETIGNLILSIVKQQVKNYTLERLYIICDGTTDGTDKKALQLSKKYPFITVINDGKRKGKLQRLMELYQRNASDFIIIFDGDVILGTPNVLNEMVNKFDQKDIAIVGANNQPVQPNTFTGRLINQWSHVWYLARLHFNNGSNVHNIRGCGIAIRKEFAKHIQFPPSLASEAQYIYFYALTQKQLFKFAKNAIVLYRKPSNMHDYFLQSRRSTPEKGKLATIFGNWIREKYSIPRKYKILALVEALVKNPILTVFGGGFYLFSLYVPYKNVRGEKDVLWKRPVSTKQPIPLNF